MNDSKESVAEKQFDASLEPLREYLSHSRPDVKTFELQIEGYGYVGTDGVHYYYRNQRTGEHVVVFSMSESQLPEDEKDLPIDEAICVDDFTDTIER